MKFAVRRTLAYLSTIEQQGNMLRSRMLAAFVQAVRHSLQADVVAIGHDLEIVIGMMGHNDILLLFPQVFRRKKHARQGKEV